MAYSFCWNGRKHYGTSSSRERHDDALRRVHETPVEVVAVYPPTATNRDAFARERGLRATGGQILWMLGVTGHSGSHSPSYGVWAESGGGSIVGKGVHPLSAALYLKQVEGLADGGAPIRPATVSARTHALTRLPGFRDEGHIRSGYRDVEDLGALHVVFRATEPVTSTW